MALRTLLWAKDQTVITSSVRRKDGKLVTSAPSPNALDKLVLIAIGDEASEHAWDALIGLEDLAVFVGCTRRAARDSLGRLERAGYVRCRHTKVESGQSGWRRIYLLSAESPLFQGLIEVDFDTDEQISRYQMRTFRDRHEGPFIPSDSLRNRPNQPIHRQEGVQGEHGSSCPGGRGNTVPPARGNTVPPEGEHGSSCGEEHGSSPSVSTSDISSSPDPENSDGRTEDGGLKGNDRLRLEVIEGVMAEHGPKLIQQLGAHASQLTQVRDRVAQAIDAGKSAVAVSTYLGRKVGEARTVRFVLGAFEQHRLHDIAEPANVVEDVTPEAPPWCGECDREGRDKPGLRRIEAADGSMRRCPNCHPEAIVRS